MKVLVYGAGAVGGYIGAKIAAIGHEVAFICRPYMMQAIQAHGFIIAKHENGVTNPIITVQLKVFETLQEAFTHHTDYDLLIAGMKSYGVDAAIDDILNTITDIPPILTIQNGIGIEERFKERLHIDKVIAGSITTPLRRERYHLIIEERADRGMGIAPTYRGQNIEPWIALLESAGIQTYRVDNHESLKWSKALLNMVGNATAAILDRHPRIIYGQKQLFNLEIDMLKEALAVMDKQKIKQVDLPGAPVKRLTFGVKRLPRALLQPLMAKTVAVARGDKLPSFQIDMNNGKSKSEVMYHNGAVVDAGKTLGIPTPVNQALTDILLEMAEGRIPRETYNGKPHVLVQVVNQYRKI